MSEQQNDPKGLNWERNCHEAVTKCAFTAIGITFFDNLSVVFKALKTRSFDFLQDLLLFLRSRTRLTSEFKWIMEIFVMIVVKIEH